jgi:putative membrane protein
VRPGDRIRRKVIRVSSRQFGDDETQHDGTPLLHDSSMETLRPPPRAKQALQIAEWAFLVGGLTLLAFLIRELGPSTVLANLRIVGWGIVLIIGQEGLAYLANTLGWLSAFPSPRPAIPFRQLLAARIAGDAINYVTPTATLGGEFVRTRFLHGQANGTALVASVTVAKLCQTIGQIVFVVIGLTVIVDETPLPPPMRHALMAGLSAFSALVMVLVIAQRRGMFAPLLRLSQRLRLSARAPELTRQLQHLDEEIARIHGNAPGAVFLSVMGFLTGWACGVVEIYLILWFLGVPVGVERALTIEVLSVAIDGMLFFVPAKVGTQEGGKVLIFTILGLDPAKGLALGILRRIRELTWALIGLLILSRQQLAVRPALEPLEPLAR